MVPALIYMKEIRPNFHSLHHKCGTEKGISAFSSLRTGNIFRLVCALYLFVILIAFNYPPWEYRFLCFGLKWQESLSQARADPMMSWLQPWEHHIICSTKTPKTVWPQKGPQKLIFTAASFLKSWGVRWVSVDAVNTKRRVNKLTNLLSFEVFLNPVGWTLCT